MTNDKTLWGIHGGKTGDAEGLFLRKNRIALGFTGVGDLSPLPANREAFKDRVRERWKAQSTPDRRRRVGQLDLAALRRLRRAVQGRYQAQASVHCAAPRRG